MDSNTNRGNTSIEQQRHFLASIVESAKDSVVTIDFDGMITTWNKAAEKLYGYPANEAIGNNLSLVVLPDDIRQLFANIERIKTTKTVEIYDTIRLHKDGELINLEVVLSPVENDDGESIGVSTVARNITDRVKAQDALTRSEEKFRALVSQTAVGIYEPDLDRKVTFVNDTVCIMLGFTREPLVGRLLVSITFEDDVKTEQRLFENFKGTRTSFEFDKRIVMGSGEKRWMKESVSAIYNSAGDLQHIMGVILDINNAKLAEEAIKHTNDHLEIIVRDRTSQLERSNEDLLQFAHVASHDLKEPLRKIRTYCNRLEDEHMDHMPSSARSYIEKIHTATDRMGSMVDGILSYSKVNAEEGEFESIDLNVLVRTIEQDLELLIQEKLATIDAGQLPIMHGSPVLIYQLLYNLINNAMKFSKPDVPPVVSITSIPAESGEGDVTVLLVSDNGIGFDQKFSKEIFDSFKRLHSKDEFEGTGLGLALCSKIIQRHGGTIEATGKPDEGSTFKILLPNFH